LSRVPYLYPPLLAALVAIFWLHALQAPFWQDDFRLLLDAREAREAGQSWLSAFWPSEKCIFWRPLSEGVYWRVVEGLLGASPVAAHVMNLLFLVCASLAVAWLVADYARLVDPSLNWQQAFLVSGLLYGAHAAHFLPAVWATAVHTSMVVLFSALALRFWVWALREQPTGVRWGLVCIPLFLLLALFSKESGILIIPLGALLTAMTWRRARPSRPAWVIAAVAAVVALVWLFVRETMIVPPSGPYAMDVGANTLRNLASMALFSLNVPRESLRFILEQQSLIAALWAVACGALFGVAFWLVLSAGRSKPGLGVALSAMAFFLIAVAPHLFFSWNAYAYYITLGLIVWPFLAVSVTLSAGRMRLVLGAALLSSLLSVSGNYALDYPALLARAKWADRQLAVIRKQFPAFAERVRAEGMDVVVENPHKFLGMGLEGLAFLLDVPRNLLREVAPGKPASPSGVRLIVPDAGNAYFEG
jgi:hypothetical protein